MFKDPGKPLDSDDFFRGSQLPTKFPNETTLMMMMQMMAEGEIKGQQSEDDNRTTRFGQAMKK